MLHKHRSNDFLKGKDQSRTVREQRLLARHPALKATTLSSSAESPTHIPVSQADAQIFITVSNVNIFREILHQLHAIVLPSCERKEAVALILQGAECLLQSSDNPFSYWYLMGAEGFRHLTGCDVFIIANSLRVLELLYCNLCTVSADDKRQSMQTLYSI
ncbi:hypothetical protein UY3_14312 [Chelonia mydas]|uniref:Uncharacterized protein n=1 Tax=Chelonia mydas TaxID=8469 RepID=M7AZL8_CHEMY|nr:hypothetical protein UY3_14312 [Chelonia mydas]